MFLDGAFMVSDMKTKGWFELPKLSGLRWMQDDTVRSPVLIEEQGKPVAVLSLGHPHIDISESRVSGMPRYTISVRLDGNVVDWIRPIGEERLKQLAERRVEKEIKETFLAGVAAGAYIYQLEYHTYRNCHSSWKKLREEGAFPLGSESLQDVRVSILVRHAGLKKAK
jgi:hypothetical protein